MTPHVQAAIDNYWKAPTPTLDIGQQMKDQLAEIVGRQAKVEFPKVEIPQVEFPRIEMPVVEFPEVELPNALVEQLQRGPMDGREQVAVRR